MDAGYNGYTSFISYLLVVGDIKTAMQTTSIFLFILNSLVI